LSLGRFESVTVRKMKEQAKMMERLTFYYLNPLCE
jgi:hypothetical protein